MQDEFADLYTSAIVMASAAKHPLFAQLRGKLDADDPRAISLASLVAVVLGIGQIACSKNAFTRITEEPEDGDKRRKVISGFLVRHLSGDWGNVDEHDRKVNDAALNDFSRIISSYEHDGETYWVITDAGWLTTTIMLPENY